METDYYNDNWYDEQYEIDDYYDNEGPDYEVNGTDALTDDDEYVMNEDDCAVEPDAYLDSSWED